LLGRKLGLVEGSTDPEEVALLATAPDLRAFADVNYLQEHFVALANLV